MHFFEKIAEERIKEAMERGDFEHLEGMGRPLPPEGGGIKIAPELRIAYKILKNAHILPVEMEMLKEIERIETLLSAVDDENECCRQVRLLNALVTTFNCMRRVPLALEKNQFYMRKLGKKLAGDKRQQLPSPH